MLRGQESHPETQRIRFGGTGFRGADLSPQQLGCPLTSSPWSREKLNGGDLLLRVLDSEPNRDAEHRVPAESGFQPKQIFSQVCSSRWSEGSRIESPRWHCCNVIEKLQLADIASWRNEGQPKDCVFQSDGLYTGCSFDNRD